MVQAVLDATVAELGVSGYAGLRIEDVASRSGVNKTTIYRRWPTKAALVEAAILEHGAEPPLRDSGDLRSDLLEATLVALARFADPERLGLIRMLQAGKSDPEVFAIVRNLRQRHRSRRVELVRRAIARGELPPRTDADLVVETILSTIYSRVLQGGESVEPAYAAAVIDLVLAGARAGDAPLG